MFEPEGTLPGEGDVNEDFLLELDVHQVGVVDLEGGGQVLLGLLHSLLQQVAGCRANLETKENVTHSTTVLPIWPWNKGLCFSK